MNDGFKDLLRVEGINFKGFGIIPKLIMLDRSLSLEAKAIYAYFASYAGNGTSSFPGRDYMLKQLNVSKNGYYGHYNQLIEAGYIEVTKNKSKDGSFSNNIYTLVSNPPNIDRVKRNFNINKEKINFTGIKSFGYGMIPKAIMIDERLTLKAKGIYAYFASYTGSGNSSFPKRDNILFHLNINESTYYTHYNRLIDLNYLTKKQRKSNGRLAINDYFLVDNPNELIVEEKELLAQISSKIPYPKKEDMDELIVNTDFPPHPKKEDTVNSNIKLPYPKKEDMEKEYTVKEYMENEDTNSNSIKSNNSIKNIHSFYENERTNELEKDIQEILEEIKINEGIPYKYAANKKLMEKIIKYISQYETLHYEYRDDVKENIHNAAIELLIDMLTSKEPIYYKNAKLSYVNIIDAVNSVLNIERLTDFIYVIEDFVSKYIEISQEYKVRSYSNHMRSCMLQFFNDYKISFAVKLNDILNNIRF